MSEAGILLEVLVPVAMKMPIVDLGNWFNEEHDNRRVCLTKDSEWDYNWKGRKVFSAVCTVCEKEIPMRAGFDKNNLGDNTWDLFTIEEFDLHFTKVWVD